MWFWVRVQDACSKTVFTLNDRIYNIHTLLLVIDKDIDTILKELNSYKKNIKFKYAHFLDLRIHQNNTVICYKDRHTVQYVNYCSQTPWKLKISWIKALYHRAHKICSNKQSLNKQLLQIKTFMA